LTACRETAIGSREHGGSGVFHGMNLLKRPIVLVIVLVLVLVAGLLGFLATWDLPAPTTRVEKVIPSDRMPR
jgi:hypothetical protein